MPGGNSPDRIDRETMASSYGFALAFMNSDPELRRLFNQAVRETWDTSRFIAKLRGTKWFKKHSADVRNAILQKTSDPATYEANVDRMYATVRDTWGQYFGRGGFDNKQLRAWAETAHRMGWSEAQLVDRLGRSVNYRKLLRERRLGGTAAETEAQLRTLIRNYGVPLGNGWIAQQVRKITLGDDTIAGVQNRVREMAAKHYPAFANDIQAGATMAEIAEPYRQRMAEMLELSANDIALTNKDLQRALKAHDKQGRPAPMTFSAFEDMVRRNGAWQYTDNAREEVANVTRNLLRDFGLTS